MLEKIIDTVEISINQDQMFIQSDDFQFEMDKFDINNSKEKDKAKKNFELQRLDVTVIHLPEDSVTMPTICDNLFCKLGCVCLSLQCGFKLKTHCGRIECMFECLCDYSKYKIDHNVFDNEIIPGLFDLDEKINSKLAKEEQKFHQTVVVKDDKSIVLKSRKRNLKTSSKYQDFYKKMRLRKDIDKNKELIITLFSLKLENIKVWCMVHELYNCFCKGRIIMKTDDYSANSGTHIINEYEISPPTKNALIETDTHKLLNTVIVNNEVKQTSGTSEIRVTTKFANAPNNITHTEVSVPFDDFSYNVNLNCARTVCYSRRQHDDSYYQIRNENIIEVEKNDEHLLNKLQNLVNKSISENNTSEDNNNKKSSFTVPKILSDLKVLLRKNTKFASWLESYYKYYRKQIEEAGSYKNVLARPNQGVLSLYPWEVILARYSNKNNYFLVSHKFPMQIYIAVDKKDPFFENCIDINDISLKDLHKYPNTVRDLINNTSKTADDFYILYGLHSSWLFIGNIRKVSNEKSMNDSIINCEKDLESNNFLLNSIKVAETCDELVNINPNENAGDFSVCQLNSKWFVMTVENDIKQIMFYNKGFFVKYDDISKAIDVARRMGKTVRISTRDSAVGGNAPQFGLYAIPNVTQSLCVLVGPYKINDDLDLETIANPNIITKKKTRGRWLVTKKSDDVKVLEDPMSLFRGSKMDISRNEDVLSPTNLDYNVKVEESKKESETLTTGPVSKTIKPIKICKTNDFYQLAPDGRLKPISPMKSSNKSLLKRISLEHLDNISHAITNSQLKPNLKNKIEDTSCNNQNIIINKLNSSTKPDDCPSVSLCNIKETSPNIKTFVGGMSILNPAEINKRIEKNEIIFKSTIETTNLQYSGKVLFPEKELKPIDVVEISDDEDTVNSITKSLWKTIWIECQNVKKLGCIYGRRNSNNEISFKFPSFQFTQYYPEKEAFMKISQVLARKVFIPRSLKLEWRVATKKNDLKNKQLLKIRDLGTDLVLSKEGLMHKREFKNRAIKQLQINQ